MRKGLVTLGVVALVLAVSPGFAEAPVLSCLPDIVISDVEQHSQTVDSDLFIFSDALSFDELVEDGDTDDSLLRWSGMDPDAMITINGIALDVVSDSEKLEPGTKDLYKVSPMATFENAVWNASGTNGQTTTETMITLYVSDGTTVAEGTVKVTTVDTAPGDAGPTDEVIPVVVASYDFAGDAQGWVWFAETAAGIKEAGHAVQAGALTMTESLPTTTVVFGGWESTKDPATAISPKTGCIMRARYDITSDGASAQVTPGMRLRGATVHVFFFNGAWQPNFGSEDYNSLDELKYGTIDFKMLSGDFDSRPPGASSKDPLYTLMVFPRQIPENLENDDPDEPVIHFFSCDLMDLEGPIENDNGTLTINSVEITGIDRPEIGEGTAVPGLSFTDFAPADWTTGVKQLPPGTLNQTNLVVSTGAELSIQISPGNENYEAFAEHATGVPLTPGQYYRLAYWCTSTELPGGDEGPLVRVNLDSEDFVWSMSKELKGGALLTRLDSNPSLMELWVAAPTEKGTTGATENMKLKFYSYLGPNVAQFPFFRLVSGTVACTEIQAEVFDPF